jgi:hypothetical protein
MDSREDRFVSVLDGRRLSALKIAHAIFQQVKEEAVIKRALLLTYLGTIAVAGSASAQQATPPAGVFNIPNGYDFPTSKSTLDQYRAKQDLTAQRTHVWNVWAGMTAPTPDGKFPVFATWYSQDEAFQTGAVPQAVGPHRVAFRFRPPRQSVEVPGHPAPQAAGTSIISEVMFDYANYKHIRDNKLYLQPTLHGLQTSGAPDPHIPNNTTVPPFPTDAISLKTVWWPVAADAVTAMPIWDPKDNPQLPTGNGFPTWKRVIAIDPNHPGLPPDAETTVTFPQTNPKPWPHSHLVGLDKFYYVKLDAQTAKNAMANGRLADFVGSVLGRPLRAGDYVVFLGTHLTTKEIDDWVWATFWWHDHPDDGSYAANRTDNVQGVWRNYLMGTAYDEITPNESDGTPHITFNPWLEAGFRNGVVSNCMNCHHRAAYRNGDLIDFLPIMRGAPDANHDPNYKKGTLRTDFLWSVPFNAQ